jgi:hypothetical protein
MYSHFFYMTTDLARKQHLIMKASQKVAKA